MTVYTTITTEVSPAIRVAVACGEVIVAGLLQVQNRDVSLRGESQLPYLERWSA